MRGSPWRLFPSSGFAGIVDDWANRYQSGAILLGTSRFYPFGKIGWQDDGPLLTIADKRSARQSAIIPNFLTWPGSALVIDPNGAYAAVTAARPRQGRRARH
jgi:hypothetical protein